ncbi:hypothetical protein FBQ81_09060 [Chloroflexi bacterium CFX6]|nr:hypothetical protein [Chloroflexi bacterium CFX6]
MSLDDKNSNILSNGKLLVEHINSQLELGKTEDEIVNHLVNIGAKREEIALFVRQLRFLNVDYISEQYKLGKTAAEIIGDLVSKGVNNEDAVKFVAHIVALEETSKNLKTQERLRSYIEQSALAQQGYKRMWRGGIIFIIGSTITWWTYSDPIGGSYYICYGAIIFGAIDFLIGLSQWQSNRN